MNEYAILSFLNEIPKTTNIENLPLHLTLLRPFRTNKDDNYFISFLNIITDGTQRITLIAKSEEMFGLSKDIPVIELESTNEIKTLQKELLDAFSESIEFKFEQYPHYRPHVTNTNGNKIKVGEKVIIDSVSLVKLDSDFREVITTLELQ